MKKRIIAVYGFRFRCCVHTIDGVMLLVVALWSSLVGSCIAQSLDVEKDVHHTIWEGAIRRSAEERASAMQEFADSSSDLLDDIKAYYRIMFDSSFASQAAANDPAIDFDIDSTDPPRYYQTGGTNHRYWIDPAPPFNPKPLHTAPARQGDGLQVRIPARYMVMFQSRATADHLTRTVAVLEEVTRTSGRKIRATDFTVYEHAAKGFTVTLNTAALDAVSTLSNSCSILFYQIRCVFTPWLSSLRKIK